MCPTTLFYITHGLKWMFRRHVLTAVAALGLFVLQQKPCQSRHTLVTSNCCNSLFAVQAVASMDLAQLQQLLTEAATLEHAKRRQALEITFLQASSSPAAAAAIGDMAAAAAAAADPASSSSEDDDDDDDAADGDGDGYEAGYSKGTRQRIQQAPADIAAQMGVPIARCVLPGLQNSIL
jgi:TolA-binding protein